MDLLPKVNILLVDDRPENLFSLEAMLDDLGENLVKANSGKQALKYLLDQEFAVILLDVQMPGIDGFEVAALIREREKLQCTPIIFLTAFDRSDTQIVKGYSLGAVDYLIKPIVPVILKAKVVTFVELYRRTQQVQAQAVQIETFNHELEQRLQERTQLNRELEAANRELEFEITERKHVEMALQRSEKLYRTLAQNLPRTAVFLFDSELRFMVVEGTLLEALGVARETVEGNIIWDVLPPDLCEFWVPHYHNAFRGESTLFEQRFGDSTYAVQVLPVKNENDDIFAGLGMIQDITELKKIQEGLQAARDDLELKVKERTSELRVANEELSAASHKSCSFTPSIRMPMVEPVQGRL